MQIVGLIMLIGVVWVGFVERDLNQITAFDGRALLMVLGGSIAAVLISSNRINAFRTLMSLRELLPFTARYRGETERLEAERQEFATLWQQGQRAQAVQLAENSQFDATGRMLKLLLSQAPKASTESSFTELRHATSSALLPSVANWELLARLGPSFGMVGTITGMIQLFRNMASQDLNIGAAMSMALLSTLYGVTFGAGLAGPVGRHLGGLLDDRLDALERCEQSVYELTSQRALSSGQSRA